MTEKRLLFDELLGLMRENGTEPDLLRRMQDPEWLPKASVENLRFLLEKHRVLKAIRAENEGLYERWRRSKGE